MQDGFQLAIYNPCRAHSKTLAAIFEGVLFLEWRSFLEPLKVKELLIWKSMAPLSTIGMDRHSRQTLLFKVCHTRLKNRHKKW